MYGVKSSQVMFSSTFKHSEGEFMSSDQQQNSGLARYRSAPSSFFASLIDDDFLNQQSSSSESDTMFAKLLSGNGSGFSESRDLEFPTVTKHEPTELDRQGSGGYFATDSQMMFQNTMPNQDSVSAHANFRSSYKVSSSSGPMVNPAQVETSGGNCSNLTRQSSSPANFFSSLTVENGVASIRDAGNYRVGSSTNGETNPSTSRFPDHINFSSRPSSYSRFMPQIDENGNESAGIGVPENHLRNSNGNNGCYVPPIPTDTWNDSALVGPKRKREDDANMFSTFNPSENGDSRNYTTALTHHLSLPKTSSEMAALDKYLQFQQDQVPCKIRAKRGFATHPRSIAERMRRTRISERMRKLQELFPNMDKQTNTAEMLDMAVEYIKDLQKQVKTLDDTRAKCTCSSKQKQPNSTA